jgi:hypothetical protein
MAGADAFGRHPAADRSQQRLLHVWLSNWHLPRSGNTYPTGNYMYGVLPGYKIGVENNRIVPAAPTRYRQQHPSIYRLQLSPCGNIGSHSVRAMPPRSDARSVDCARTTGD